MNNFAEWADAHSCYKLEIVNMAVVEDSNYDFLIFAIDYQKLEVVYAFVLQDDENDNLYKHGVIKLTEADEGCSIVKMMRKIIEIREIKI